MSFHCMMWLASSREWKRWKAHAFATVWKSTSSRTMQKKFFGLLLRKNGYVLEQLSLPPGGSQFLGSRGTERIAAGCITRHHWHHYFGFAETQWKLFEKEQPRRVKPLLYVYRVLLTGIHLMRTGSIEANLVTL